MLFSCVRPCADLRTQLHSSYYYNKIMVYLNFLPENQHLDTSKLFGGEFKFYEGSKSPLLAKAMDSNFTSKQAGKKFKDGDLEEKSISTRIGIAVPKLRYCQPSFFKPKIKTSYNLKSEVGQDVALFSLEKTKFFVFLNLLSATQCFFWTWMGLFLFRFVRDPAFEIKKPGFWATVLEKERQHSNVLSGLSLFFGFSIFVGTFVYSVRSVRKLILHKGGKEITIITYNIPGLNKFKVPLTDISASQHRSKAKKFISLKIKNRFFYYLLDVNGEISNPVLFDFTAGVKRNL